MLELTNVTGQIVAFQGDLAAKRAVFVIQITGPAGENLGQVPLGIQEQAQEETASQFAIEGWDEMLANSVEAQNLIAALNALGLKLADEKSKIIAVTA